MKKVTLTTEVHGLEFVDEWVIYPCRHVHHKWSMNGDGPKRARRIKMDNYHYKRLKQLEAGE